MNKILKALLIFLLSLLILAGIAALIAPTLLQKTLKSALEDEFARQTSHQYTLKFSTFNIGILTRTISIDSILIQPDTSFTEFRKIAVSSISISGIKWRSLLNRSFPDFAAVIIRKPEIELFVPKLSASSLTDDTANQNADLVKNLSGFDIVIKDGRGKLVRQNRTEVLIFEGFSMEANNVNLPALFDTSELVFMENLTLHGSRLEWLLERQLYRFTIENFSFDKKSEYLALSDLALTPVLPKYEFSKIRAKQINRFDIRIPAIELSGFDLNALAEQHLEIDSLKIRDVQMEVFRDKQKEPAPGLDTKPMLNEIAHAINFSFGVNTLIISGTDITYELHKPPSDTTGVVSFNNINATLSKFRSARHPDFQKDTLKLHAETLFMDTAPLTVDIYYPVFNKNNIHTVKAKLGSMDPKAAENILENAAFVRIEDGYIEKLEAKIELNSETSVGEVLVLYRDLKVSFLNKEQPDRRRLRQKAGNFLANTFVIKSENTIENPRIGVINFERNKEKAILAFWAQSILDGIQKSIR